MSDKGRGSGGRLSKTIHLYILVILFLAAGCAAASAQTLSFDQQNMTYNVTIVSTPAPLPTGIPASSDLSGSVLDSKGNKVPGAYVVLYMDKNTAPIGGNPTYSDDAGGYRFTGLQPGNYTIKAEKADIFMFNGTASLVIQTDTDARMDVALSGYVFTVFVTPTPAPLQPAVEPALLPTAGPAAAPVNEGLIGQVKDKALVLVLIAFGVAIAGAVALTVKVKIWPKKKTLATIKVPAVDAKTESNISKEVLKSGDTARTFTNAPGYMEEIAELVKMSATTGYGDIAVLNRINTISKKFSVDQNTVFTDIKKFKTQKP